MTNPIKAIIIEDELFNREQLRFKIQNHFPDINIVATCEHAAAGIDAIRAYRPELVFLDIEMPDMNGFEMLRHLDELNFEVIFTTAHNKYAINAIRFSALDYLMKPIQTDELTNAMQRFVSKRKEPINAAPRIRNVIENIAKNEANAFKLAIATTEGSYFFKTEEIIRCEGHSNYTLIVLHNKKTLMTSKTLKEYEEMLEDYAFIRVHKSHLVNQKHIQSLQAERHLLMSDGSTVEISKRRFKEVKELL